MFFLSAPKAQEEQLLRQKIFNPRHSAKMPSKSSGRIEKARKNKGGTPHKKNHRWESFSTKISKFNSLQPLRKVRRHDLETEDLSAATSYFHNGLQRWGELNISKDFTSFKREVLPLSESLPQILHFEERIMDSLATHIAAQDRESLEPLLDLLTAFAHDLGVRFEKHYQKSLELLLAVAGRPQDVDVIEWTFGAMAFLFKYLSKLLVPDLRPTFDVMAPLLGKSRHPSHIARFAAEAMSFLVRKAAAPSHRETSLPLLVNHAAKDLQSVSGDRQFILYKDGLMTMFAEAIKSTDYTIHSAGASIFTAIIDAIPDEEKKLIEEPTWTEVACGVLTSAMHHSTVDTFKEFCDSTLDKLEQVLEAAAATEWCLMPYVKLLGVLSGVRRGSRISEWHRIVRLIISLLEKTAKAAQGTPQDGSSLAWKFYMVNVAIVWHHAPVDALIPFMGRLVHVLTREPFMKWFIPFCAYFCELDSRRFGSLFRTEFQKFVATHWSHGSNEDVLCVLLPVLIEHRGFPPSGDKDCFKLPQAWQDQIVLKFERLEISPFPERGPYDKDPDVWRERCLPKYSALLRILEVTAVHPSTNARIAELLLRKLKLALRPSSTLASDEVHFIVSQGFHAYLRMSQAAGSVDTSLSPLLRAAVPRFARSLGFLHAYLAYEQIIQGNSTGEQQDSSSSDGSATEDDPVTTSLVENLAAPSHEIRLASLQLLKLLNDTQESGQLVETMIQLEETPLALDQTRAIAMLLRRLGQLYAAVAVDSWLKHGVPHFMFGMLTVKLSPVWDDAVEALKQVSQNREGEEIVSSIAFKWLDVPSARWTPPSPQGNNSNTFFRSDFECTAYNGLSQSANSVETAIDNPDEKMLNFFDDKQGTADINISNARSRALKVFSAMPSVAEKRSRRLVPYFLSWAGNDNDTAAGDEDEDRQQGATWSLADRKALLGVFSQFINPRVLYLHEQVYDALLQLIENGDAEVQKSALKALLAWKQEGVKPYQENLEYLLDEARFKNELTVFLQGENLIRPEHRQELMPVLLRLLYGRTISKKGAASGRHGLQATRLAVLRNLSVEDLGNFLDIATGKLSGVRAVGSSLNRDQLLSKPIIPVRKQVGFLNMILSMISELGTNVTPYMDTLVNAVLLCLGYACRHLRETGSNEDEALAEDEEEASAHSLLKVARATGIKCLVALFQNAQDYQWSPYHDFIIEEVVAPRLTNFSAENTQGVSGLLQLLSTWSALPRSALFLAPHGDVLPEGVLPHIITSLSIEKTKDDVKICILKLICNLVKLASAPASESEFNEVIKAELLDPIAEDTIAHIATVLKLPLVSSDLMEVSVETILSFATVLEESNNVQEVIPISTYLLKQPPRRVSPKTKGKVLLVVERFLSLPSARKDQSLVDEVYETLSSLFSYFKDRENREALSRAITVIAEGDESLKPIARLCVDLNSFKEGRIDEPDYDKRLAAFNGIAGQSQLPPRQWLPLLHNLIFFIKVDEEFGILSSNSADGLRHFIKDVANCKDAEQKQMFEDYLTNIVMPALYSGARELSETVRREFLRVLGFLLSAMPQWGPMADLSALLNERQEDTSEPTFFFNILSPATARQLEALRLLEAANNAKEMGSQMLAQFFIPLLERFIFDREEGSDDHGLGAQAANTIGALAMSLNWKHYRTTMQRYTSYVGNKPEAQKQTIRLLGQFVDALIASLPSRDPDSMEVEQPALVDPHRKRLSTTIPQGRGLHTEIVDHFLPPLLKYLHEKDESEVSYRVPIGVVIVKLLKALPSDELDQKLAGVLTDICHILRSKSSESRDLTRDTLVKIAGVLGPSFFGFILKELRSALTKGYQLHVLSYTVHSILVATAGTFAPGDLDYCLPAIVAVIMDDIFGVVGQEKDAEGYISQMKEVKGSKSQDSMELIAKTASVSRLIALVKPLQALLMQKVDLKMVRKIDALMARITAGLVQNAAAESQDTLVFCYEVIQVVYDSQKPEAEVKIDPRVKKYLVQKGAKKSGDRGTTTKHTYKLTRFAFDILRSMFKKHDSLRTPSNVAGFLPLLGDAIIDGEDEVKMSAFRLLAVLVKVPFSTDDGTNIYKVAVKEATKSISMSSATTTEIAQAALKMLAVVLRDRRDVIVKDAAIDMLLGKLKDDLTQILYRHVTFNFLRAVLDRRIETATVYDIMDYVGTVMITNDDKDTRDLARGAFFQFIREYPQKKARWGKQLSFIVANLKYEREGGRLSVMEVLHLLLLKSSNEFIQEVAATCFLPLFFVLANDDSDKCRLAATELLKEVFRKSDKERVQKFLTLLRSWIENDGNTAVQRLGFQVFGYYFESYPDASKNKKDYNLVLGKATGILSSDLSVADAELLESILGAMQILTSVFPDKILSKDNEALWKDIARCMSHDQHGVQLVAVRLIAMFLADFAKQGSTSSAETTIGGSYGLQLSPDDVQELVTFTLSVLNGNEVDETLATEAGQILVFLAHRLPASTSPEDDEVEKEEQQDEDVEGGSTLHYLFQRLSHILRKEISPKAAAITCKVVAMDVLETICRRSSKERLQNSLKTILSPLHNITDPTIAAPHSSDELFKTKHEGLKTRAQILMDSLQKKFGTSEYSKQLLAVREEVKAKRQQRSSKRKIEAIAHPEKYGRDKRKKMEKEKERRKTRSREQKTMRQSYKGW
ncbi:U4 small nucleolar RNA-associated protein [Paramyrothecium foliicola]|nr:U4 small nucleolar RNA-associated protein [Paramyrothecium foliicola]